MVRKKFFYFITIIFISFLSYQYNFFQVTSSGWFNLHQIDSEQLVLDGILHSTNNKKFHLGRYSRPKLKNQFSHARELFVAKNIDGVFEEYCSQYGIQGKFFSYLYSKGITKLSSLQSVSSIIMSLVVAFFFLLIQRDFKTKYAIIFTSVLIFSPWVVVFARNLYWVEALWFLPMLITMFFSNTIFVSKKNYFCMLVILYFVFLIKFLSGYEYITSIVIASFFPVIYQGMTKKFNKIKIIKYLIPIGIISILSFSTSILLHANSISKNGDGFNNIYSRAQTRISLNKNDRLIAEEVCNGDKECIEIISSSLKANHIYVIGRYFWFEKFMPWIGSISFKISNEQKKYIKSILRNQEINYVNKFIVLTKYTITNLGISNTLSLILNSVISPLFFILLIFFYIKSFKNLNNNDKIFTLLLFLAPISWFFIAKPHSYIHTHMNYVLWYLPSLPYLVMILYSNYIKNNKDNGTDTKI